MNYLEIKLEAADEVQAEIYMAELADYAFESFEQNRNILKAYIRKSDFQNEESSIRTYLESVSVPYTVTEIETVNWNSEWESNFEPVEVEGRFVVRAPFHDPRPDVTEIVIMPKMSFGTGHHATTWLMLSSLADVDVSGKKGLDMGSGTGVLAIGAVKCGAAHFDAVDIDGWAYENCIENITVNGAEGRVRAVMGDVTAIPSADYDIILANINRNILVEDLPKYIETLKSGGYIIMSGILDEDLPVISARAAALGLEIISTKERGGWAALTCLKK